MAPTRVHSITTRQADESHACNSAVFFQNAHACNIFIMQAQYMKLRKGYVMRPIFNDLIERYDSGEPISNERNQRLKRWWRAARANAEAKKTGKEQHARSEDISEAVSSTLDVFRKVENVNQGEQDTYTPMLAIGVVEDDGQHEIAATVGIQWKTGALRRNSPSEIRDALKEPGSFSARDISRVKIFIYRLPHNPQDVIGRPLESTPKPGDAEELCHIVVNVGSGTTNVSNIGMFNELIGIVNGTVAETNAGQPVLASN